MCELLKYEPEFQRAMIYFTEAHRNRREIRKHLTKQIDAIVVMIDAFTPDEIITHIFSNQNMYNINAFTTMKFHAAMYMVQNNIHK